MIGGFILHSHQIWQSVKNNNPPIHVDEGSVLACGGGEHIGVRQKKKKKYGGHLARN